MDFVSALIGFSGIFALGYAVYAHWSSSYERGEKTDEIIQEIRTATETMRNTVRSYAMIVVATILIIAALVLARPGGPGRDPKGGAESTRAVDTLVVVDTVFTPSPGQDAVVPGTDTLGTGDPPGHHR